GDGRDHLPATRVRLLAEAGETDIDTAHHLENIVAVRHRRPSAAVDEIGIGRLGGRESVGLVQEAANGNTGHEVIPMKRWGVRWTLVSLLRGASANNDEGLRVIRE